jgi:putative flippase GtrA
MRVAPLLLAFLRFAVNGAGVALVAVGAYLAGVHWLGLAPLAANLVAYLTQLAVGYQVHRMFSFAHAPQTRASMMRFGILSVGAFLLNTLWVWLLTGLARLPAWTAVAPMVGLTPIVTFLAARHWVFAKAAREDLGLD